MMGSPLPIMMGMLGRVESWKSVMCWTLTGFFGSSHSVQYCSRKYSLPAQWINGPQAVCPQEEQAADLQPEHPNPPTVGPLYGCYHTFLPSSSFFFSTKIIVNTKARARSDLADGVSGMTSGMAGMGMMGGGDPNAEKEVLSAPKVCATYSLSWPPHRYRSTAWALFYCYQRYQPTKLIWLFLFHKFYNLF